MQSNDDTINVYTDGACRGNPGPAGIGFVLKWRGHTKELSEYIGHATNNIAELTAILKALHTIKNKKKTVVMYTDSSYAHGVLTKGWKVRANKALIHEISKEMGLFKDLRIVKVEGHAGILENERADRLARDAIES